MIRKISLRFGAAPRKRALSFSPGAFTIFVGPNNSGKSRTLHEISTCFTNAQPQQGAIVRRLRLGLPPRPLRSQLLARIRKDLEPLIGPREVRKSGEEAPASPNSAVAAKPPEQNTDAVAMALAAAILPLYGLDLIKRGLDPKKLAKFLDIPPDPQRESPVETGQTALILMNGLATWLKDQRKAHGINKALAKLLRARVFSIQAYAELFGRWTILLDGKTRLNQVESTPPPNFEQKDANHFVNLLKNEEARKEFRRIVYEAFKLYPVIDTTSFRQTALKLSPEDPKRLERSNDEEALRFFRRATDIRHYSDGVKSFTGLIASLLSDDYLLMLIDEPEAFLHPPLARKLGFELHQLARKRKAHVFAATHSAEFVTGSLQAGHNVNIIRLTYRDGQATARQLPIPELQRMMRDPLLRSTGVLSALFHEGAIICAGDADRALYQEINDRLRSQKEGLDGCIFLNAHSKQSIHKVLAPLRAIGIPAAAIVDCDLIGTEDDHQKLLKAVQAEGAINAIGTAKKNLFDRFAAKIPDSELENLRPEEQDRKRREKARTLIKRQGLRALSPKEQEEAKATFIEPLASFGIFVVPGGELETWLEDVLPPTSAKREKNEWITTLFEKMGSDPEGNDYVRPGPTGHGDIWDFMRQVVGWIAAPKRGLP